MKVNAKKAGSCRMKLVVEIEPERIEKRYQEVLKQFQKAARLPGFRDGKAPADLVEKKYAREAEEELIKTLVPEAYHQAVVNEKLAPVSLPSISDVKLERGKKLTFAAEFDTAPEFSLKGYKGIKLKKEPIDVKEDDVEKGVQSLVESKAELVPILEARAVQKGDFLVSDIEIIKDGKSVPAKKNVLLYAEPNQGDDFFDKIVGAQIDDVREISVDPTEEEKKQGIIGRRPYYKVWVKQIQQKRLPALDDAFAKGFGMDSVDALKSAVRKDIAQYKNSQSQSKMREELFSKLLKLVTFEVPKALIDKQHERLVEQALRRAGQKPGSPAAAAIEAEAGAKAEEQVKLYFILQKIADEESIDLDELELEQKLNALAAESKRPIEEVRTVFEDDMRESMKEKATVDYLLANANFSE